MHLVHWFRSKGLRFHDQPSLFHALRLIKSQVHGEPMNTSAEPDQAVPSSSSSSCGQEAGVTAMGATWRCVYLLDPWFVSTASSVNKWQFLMQSLEDLDNSLRRMGSRLFVIRGQPNHVFPRLFREWGVTHVSFEQDPEPFAKVRDAKILQLCSDMGIQVSSRCSHTLFHVQDILDACSNGSPFPLTFASFQAIIASPETPQPAAPCPAVDADLVSGIGSPVSDDHDRRYGIPSLKDLGFQRTAADGTFTWPGGETEALSRLQRHLQHKAWVAAFGSPRMSPSSLITGSQTGLTPYLRFGCLSARLFYHQLSDLYRRLKNESPPHSLHGQLLWRDFFYVAASNNPHFDRMQGNEICVQIPWDRDPIALMKWAEGKTGFPWIDAIQTQLRLEGWIHPVARHATICFLTRGTLWLSWEEGMRVFDEMLLDADWSVNAGTWMWMSCSSFFQSHFQAYCPVAFGRKVDPNGDYIRKYLPCLRNFPTTWIHEPWHAPAPVQQKAKCLVGKHYPLPMIDHVRAARTNAARMRRVLTALVQSSTAAASAAAAVPTAQHTSAD